MHVRSSMRAHSPLSGSSVNGSCAQDTDQKHGKHPQCRVSRHEGEEMEVLVPRKVRPNHRAFGVLVAFDESEQPQVVSVSTGVEWDGGVYAQCSVRSRAPRPSKSSAGGCDLVD